MISEVTEPCWGETHTSQNPELPTTPVATRDTLRDLGSRGGIFGPCSSSWAKLVSALFLQGNLLLKTTLVSSP